MLCYEYRTKLSTYSILYCLFLKIYWIISKYHEFGKIEHIFRAQLICSHFPFFLFINILQMSHLCPSSIPYINHSSAIQKFDSRGRLLPCYCTDCSNLRKAETTTATVETIVTQTVAPLASAPSVPLATTAPRAVVAAVLARPAPAVHTVPTPVVVQTAPGSSYSNAEDTNSAMLCGLAGERERSRVPIWNSRGSAEISVHPSIATMMHIGATQRAVAGFGNIKFVR